MQVPALQNLSFGLEQGEVLTFLGESGSGKTTLLKLLSGLLNADSGEVWLDGKQITGPAKQLVAGYEEVRLVNQDFGLGHKLKVWENLRYHLLKYSKPAQEKRIAELIAVCQLEGLENNYSHELSGGQQQRVALGRALANEPRLLLLDEPFSNLDTRLKNQLRTDLERIIRKTETTAIFVMHDSADALPISDKIGILQAGELQQIASPQEIYQNPKSAYIAQFFGNPTILTVSELKKLFPSRQFTQSDQTQICIRENAVKHKKEPTNESIKLKVEKVNFMGSFSEVFGKHKSGIHLRLHTKTKNKIQLEQTIFVELDWEKVIWLD
jgi:ABC-type Fe3+/spermidine/putrescine transport system ATPase subunit